jgi:hypothetical protein
MRSALSPRMSTEAPPAAESREGKEEESAIGLRESASRFPFGPSFFLDHLGGLVKDRCPIPEDGPEVYLHLSSGEVIDLCNIIGLTSDWIAVTAYDEREDSGGGETHTELIPYGTIMRVAIHGLDGQTARRKVGFRIEPRPEILLPKS